MPYNLMHDIRLRSIVRILDVTQILRRAKDLKGKGIEKLPLTQYSMRGLDPKSGACSQIRGQFVELWNPIGNSKRLIELSTLLQEPLTHGGLMQPR
jgi:hypothetical protein